MIVYDNYILNKYLIKLNKYNKILNNKYFELI
jgi:hypothetical protein